VARSALEQDETAALLAAFDSMASHHRAAAAERAKAPVDTRPFCSANVGHGSTIHQCKHRATQGAYCTRHSQQENSGSLDDAPAGLEDTPDPFAW
jgi:hypothetical protein